MASEFNENFCVGTITLPLIGSTNINSCNTSYCGDLLGLFEDSAFNVITCVDFIGNNANESRQLTNMH